LSEKLAWKAVSVKRSNEAELEKLCEGSSFNDRFEKLLEIAKNQRQRIGESEQVSGQSTVKFSETVCEVRDLIDESHAICFEHIASKPKKTYRVTPFFCLVCLKLKLEREKKREEARQRRIALVEEKNRAIQTRRELALVKASTTGRTITYRTVEPPPQKPIEHDICEFHQDNTLRQENPQYPRVCTITNLPPINPDYCFGKYTMCYRWLQNTKEPVRP